MRRPQFNDYPGISTEQAYGPMRSYVADLVNYIDHLEGKLNGTTPAPEEKGTPGNAEGTAETRPVRPGREL